MCCSPILKDSNKEKAARFVWIICWLDQEDTGYNSDYTGCYYVILLNLLSTSSMKIWLQMKVQEYKPDTLWTN